MADLVSIGISVTLTLTLQSAYLALVKFPRTFLSEQTEVLNSMRLSSAAMEEGQFISQLVSEATTLCYSVNDFIDSDGHTEDSEDLVTNLIAAEARLNGLLNCREPEATHVKIIAEGVRRTKSLITDDLSPLEKGREALAIVTTNKSSLQALSLRTNGERLALADLIEQRTNVIDHSLLEFYGACALSYGGVLLVSFLVLHTLDHASFLGKRAAITIGFSVFVACNLLMGRLRKIGDAARSVVKLSHEQVDGMRQSLRRIT